MQSFADVTGHHGESFSVAERVVVSPSAGVFQAAHAAAGYAIPAGAVIGHIADHEVRSPFAGTLMGMCAVSGERVQAGQRIAWLRLHESPHDGC